MKDRWLRLAGLTVLLMAWGFMLYGVLDYGIEWMPPGRVLSNFLWWLTGGDTDSGSLAALSCIGFVLVVCSAPLVVLRLVPTLIRTLRASDDGTTEDEQPE